MLLDQEPDKAFVKRLGTFAEPFAIPSEQAALFLQQLDAAVAGDEEDEQ